MPDETTEMSQDLGLAIKDLKDSPYSAEAKRLFQWNFNVAIGVNMLTGFGAGPFLFRMYRREFLPVLGFWAVMFTLVVAQCVTPVFALGSISYLSLLTIPLTLLCFALYVGIEGKEVLDWIALHPYNDQTFDTDSFSRTYLWLGIAKVVLLVILAGHQIYVIHLRIKPMIPPTVEMTRARGVGAYQHFHASTINTLILSGVYFTCFWIKSIALDISERAVLNLTYKITVFVCAISALRWCHNSIKSENRRIVLRSLSCLVALALYIAAEVAWSFKAWRISAETHYSDRYSHTYFGALSIVYLIYTAYREVSFERRCISTIRTNEVADDSLINLKV